jgi:hypothetical protein
VVSGNDLKIKNVHSQVIKIKPEDYEGKENIILDDIEDCEIYLPFLIKSIYGKTLKRVKLYAGCVAGACFLNDA